MNISLLPGRLIIVKDPLQDRQGLILFPDVEVVQAHSALCLLHEPSAFWTWTGEAPLTSRRIIFTKWTGKDFEYKGTLLHVLREPAVLAVFDEE